MLGVTPPRQKMESSMSQSDRQRTVVLALGNLIRSDDGIGLHALRRLEEDPSVPSSISFVEGGTKGLGLVPYICNVSRLLVLDALDVGSPPGTVLRMTEEDLLSMPGNGSVHELALADILNALRMLGQEPQEIVLLGVQPATTELGTTLSAPLQDALPALLKAAIAELSRWAYSVPDERREDGEPGENTVAISVKASQFGPE